EIIAQGTQFGVGLTFLRFSRDFEKQADLEGTQIMSLAGYDARDMANMFKTSEKQGGSGGPQFLSVHPNPANRYDYIVREAQSLPPANRRDSGEFERIRARLKGMPKAPTSEQVAKNKGGTTSRGPDTAPSGRVAKP